MFRLGSRPGTGSYALVDPEAEGQLEPDDWAAILLLDVGQFGFGAYAASGTVTVTSSSTERVEGTFEIEVTGIDPSTRQEVTATVTGWFEAVDAIPGTISYPTL